MNNLLLKPEDKASLLTQAAFAFVLLALLLFGAPVSAETVIEEIAYDDAAADSVVSVEPIEPLSAEELGDLVGPIALYPDDLIAIVLPASTYPLQIVQAVRFLEARKDDASLEPSEDWDDSIVALLNYPEVLELMNNDLDWTWKLGEAVLIQQEEVIVAVRDFRERARVAGNLESDEHQIVDVIDDGSIEIKPADPEVIYVPYYEPSRVTVYHDYPVYHYYPRGYPVYYYPYPRDYAFSSGFFWGVTSAFSIGWSTHHLHQHHYGYRGHPYYGRRYYDYHYYRRPHLSLSRDYYYSYIERYRRPIYRRHHEGNYWQPRHHRRGASPRYRDRHYRHPERHGSDSYRHRDRHEHQPDHRDGRSGGGGFDGVRPRQQRQFVADGGRDVTDLQRRQRRAQLDGHKAARRNPARAAEAVPVSVPASKPGVIARGTNHRSAMPSVRTMRQAPKADRRDKRHQRDRQRERVAMARPNPNRKPNAVPRRAARSVVAQQSHVQHRAARQQARVSLPQARPRQAQPQRSQPKRSQPKQSQPKQQSQPRRVASAPTGSRGSANRSSRATNNHGVTRRSFRSPH